MIRSLPDLYAGVAHISCTCNRWSWPVSILFRLDIDRADKTVSRWCQWVSDANPYDRCERLSRAWKAMLSSWFCMGIQSQLEQWQWLENRS